MAGLDQYLRYMQAMFRQNGNPKSDFKLDLSQILQHITLTNNVLSILNLKWSYWRKTISISLTVTLTWLILNTSSRDDSRQGSYISSFIRICQFKLNLLAGNRFSIFSSSDHDPNNWPQTQSQDMVLGKKVIYLVSLIFWSI